MKKVIFEHNARNNVLIKDTSNNNIALLFDNGDIDGNLRYCPLKFSEKLTVKEINLILKQVNLMNLGMDRPDYKKKIEVNLEDK